MNEASPYIRVEYAQGKSADQVQTIGDFAYVPVARINYYAEQGSVDPVCDAFKEATGLGCSFIMSYTVDELFDSSGELLRE